MRERKGHLRKLYEILAVTQNPYLTLVSSDCQQKGSNRHKCGHLKTQVTFYNIKNRLKQISGVFYICCCGLPTMLSPPSLSEAAWSKYHKEIKRKCIKYMKEENDKPTKERSHQEIILRYGLVRTWIMNYNCQFGIFACLQFIRLNVSHLIYRFI